MADSSRRYSDREVAEILSRAADLGVRQSGPRGSSLEEVERIAAEAGIDGELVRRAAAQVSIGRPRQRPSVWRRLLGPLQLRFETVVPGEIDEGAHEELFDVVQHTLGVPGTLNRAGRSFSFSVVGQQRNVNISVSSRNGQTTVRVEEALGQLAGGVWGGVLGGAGGGISPLAGIAVAALGGGPVGVTAAVVGTLGVITLGTRALYGSLAARREDGLNRAFEELVATVEARARTSGAAETGDDSALLAARARAGVTEAPARELVGEGAAEQRTVGVAREAEDKADG